jgi:hypothetical protein
MVTIYDEYLKILKVEYMSSHWSVTFFPPAGLVWKFFPEGAQTVQTVLKPKAEGQSGFFGLLKERIFKLDPTWDVRMTFLPVT